jgi:hypothetical protein
VKSLSASAAGPTMRRGFFIASSRASSTTSRAGRSVRLHSIARRSVTSPVMTPDGTAGRIRSDVTIAGAPCAKARGAASTAPAPAMKARRVVRIRLVGLGMLPSVFP